LKRGEIRLNAYIDSTIAINLVENDDVFAPMINAWFLKHDAEMAASDLTRMESRVKPLRNFDLPLLADFEIFFARRVKTRVELHRSVWDRAAKLRANHRFLKGLDAIHLAAAIEARCTAFVTNEKRLSSVKEIPVIVIA